MNRHLLLVAALAPLSVPAQEDAPPAVDLLANGLDAWEGDLGYWRLEGDVLVGESRPERPLERTTYLTWNGGEVADFELTFQFRIQGGNSGLQFRSRRGAEHAVSGYQADIEDGPSWTGGIYEQDGRGVVCRRGERVTFDEQGGKHAETFADGDELQRKILLHEWNEYRVRAVGERIELFVNGLPTAEMIDRDPARAARAGVLALQLHQGPPMKVEFRHFALRHLGGGGPAGPPQPQWIWSSSGSRDGERMWARRAVALEGELAKATLLGSCDNACRVALNGEVVAESEDWAVPFRVDVTRRLRPGENVIEAACRNEGSVAGLWLELDLVFADGRRASVASDAGWSVAASEPAAWPGAPAGEGTSWSSATVLGALGCPPWGVPTRWSDGRGGEGALAAEELELAEGFAAELLYSVPKAAQGSWVCLAFDPAGCLLASDQYGALYRATVPPLDPSGGELAVERLELDLGRAQGLLCAFGSLYVVVAEGQGTGLYRAREVGDGSYGAPELLFALDGSGEHGPHAIVAGPDGRSLYLVGGNHTKVPPGIERSRPTPVWGEDQLLPRLEDPNGHAVGVMAPGGWVVRMDPDGTHRELVAIGMRNAYDIAFDAGGELFTFDSDMEWDVGLPWYRPTRILHLVSGADFGWRNGSGKWPAHYPDSLPAVVDLGVSSPTGVVFGTHSAFHAPYRSALFAADWAYGTIYAVHLEPAGASFRGRSEVFARGKPFPVTDLAVGPDGALYVTTGGRRTQSGVYRIRSLGEPAPEPREGEVPPERLARRVIERNHGLGVPSPYWAELGSPDRFLAHAARTALEDTPAEHWAERALAEPDPALAVQALLALVRTHPTEYAARVRARLLELALWETGGASFRDSLRVLGLSIVRGGPPSAEEAARWAEHLTAAFGSGDEELDRELFRLLVRLEAPAAARLGVERLVAAEGEDAQAVGLFYAFALRTLEGGWTLPLRRAAFQWLNEVAPRFAGGHSLVKYLEHLRAGWIERLPEELRAWPDLLAPPAQDAAPVEAAAFVRAWGADDLVPRLGEVKAGRDHARGERAYQKATCAECHRIGALGGGSTGPDLTGAGSRFNARDLLSALLLPSETISDQYQETEVRTREGAVHVGRLVREEAGTLVLRVWSPREEDVEIPLADVELRRPHPLSRMPSGLLDVLEESEILDLLAYVLAGGNAADPAFGGR